MATEQLNIVITERGSRRVSNNIENIGKRAKKTGNAVRFMRSTLIGIAAARAIRAAVTMTNTYQNMGNRIRTVTSTAKEFNTVQKRISQIAKASRADLAATSETYVRLRKATKDLGTTNEEVFSTLETINNMLAVSGATTMEAEQGIRQLSQAFSKGKLDGDEFRTISEALPDILDVLQKSLGVTRGELRDMSEQGKITTKVLLKAFKEAEGLAKANLANTPRTLAQKYQILTNVLMESVGAWTTTSGVAETFGEILLIIASNLDIVLTTAALLGITLTAVLLHKGSVIALVNIGKAIAFIKNQMLLLNLTFKANPIGIAIAAAVAAGLALQAVIDSISGGGGSKEIEIDTSSADSVQAAIDRKRAELEKARAANKDVGSAEFSAFGGDSFDFSDDIDKSRRALNVLQSQLFELQKTKFFDDGGQKVLDNLEGQFNNLIDKTIPKLKFEFASIAILANGIFSTFGAKNLVPEFGEDFVKLKQDLDPVAKANAEFAESMKVLNIEREKFKDHPGKLADVNTQMSRLTEEHKAARHPLKAFLDAQNEDLRVTKLRGAAKKREVAATKITNKLRKAGTEIGAAELKELVDKQLILDRINARSKGSGPSLRDQLRDLREELDPTLAAQRELTEGTKILDKALRRKMITDAQHLELRRELNVSLKDAIDPGTALIKQLQEETFQLGLNDKARKARKQELADDAQIKPFLDRGDTASIPGLLTAQDDLADAKALSEHGKEVEKIMSGIRKEIDPTGLAIEAYTKQLSVLEADQLLAKPVLSSKEFAAATKELADATWAARLPTQAMIVLLGEQVNVLAGATSATSSALDMKILELKLSPAWILATDLEREALEKLTKAKFDLDAENKKSAATKAKETKDKSLAGGMNRGIKTITDDIKDISDETEDLFVNTFNNAEDAMVKFFATGKFEMGSFIDSLLADFARLAVNAGFKLLFNAASGGGGASIVGDGLLAPTFGAMHGGTMVANSNAGFPGYANGGSFMVDNSGQGPDTNLVAFRASHGERVTVTPPGQTKLEDRAAAGGGGGVGVPIVQIINTNDPTESLSALETRGGSRRVMNTIARNPRQLRKFLR